MTKFEEIAQHVVLYIHTAQRYTIRLGRSRKTIDVSLRLLFDLIETRYLPFSTTANCQDMSLSENAYMVSIGALMIK
jgi:hypothetical protein